MTQFTLTQLCFARSDHLPPPCSMTKLLHEVEGLRERCLQLEGKLATSEREVQHLKLANQHASDDIVHLRHTVRTPR